MASGNLVVALDAFRLGGFLPQGIPLTPSFLPFSHLLWQILNLVVWIVVVFSFLHCYISHLCLFWNLFILLWF